MIKDRMDIIYVVIATILLVMMLVEIPVINPESWTHYQIFVIALSSVFIYVGTSILTIISEKHAKDERLSYISHKTGNITFGISIIGLIIFTTNFDKINIKLGTSDLLQLIPVIMCYIYSLSFTITRRIT